MIKTFADRRTQDLFINGKAKRFPPDVAKRAARKLEYVNLATKLEDLRVPPGNRLHALKGNRKDNIQFRSMINGAYASDLLMEMLMTLRYVIIIRIR